MNVKEDICNAALAHLGKGTIVAINETSTEAKKCKLHYDTARKLALSFSPWTFATKTRNLAKLVNNELSDVWDYCYDLPTDSLQSHMRLVEQGQTPVQNLALIPLHIEDGKLYTNLPDAKLFYTYDSTEVATWSPMFSEAVSYMLATRMAPSLNRRKADAQDLMQSYYNAVAKAVEQDAGQVHTTYIWANQ